MTFFYVFYVLQKITFISVKDCECKDLSKKFVHHSLHARMVRYSNFYTENARLNQRHQPEEIRFFKIQNRIMLDFNLYFAWFADQITVLHIY